MDISEFRPYAKDVSAGVTAAELDAFEKKNDLVLPDDFKKFYTEFNGLDMDRVCGRINPLGEAFIIEPIIKLLAFTSSESNFYCLCCAGELTGMMMYYPHDGVARLAGMSFSDFLENLLVTYRAFLLEPTQIPNPYKKSDSSIALLKSMLEVIRLKIENEQMDEGADPETNNTDAAINDDEPQVTDDSWPAPDGLDVLYSSEYNDNYFDLNERIDPWGKYSQQEKSLYALKVIDASFRAFSRHDDCTLPRIVEGALKLLTADDLPQIRYLLKHENYYVRNEMLSYVHNLPEPFCTEAYEEYLQEMNQFARRVLTIYKKHGIPAELQEKPSEMPVLTWGEPGSELHLQMMYCYKDDPIIEEVLIRNR